MADNEMDQVLLTVWVTDSRGTHEKIIVYDNNSPLPKGVKFMNGQLERCPTSGRLHWQCFVQSQRKHPAIWFQKLFSKEKGVRDRHGNGTSTKSVLCRWVHFKQVHIDNGASSYGHKDDSCEDPNTRFQLGTLDHGNKCKTELKRDAILACTRWEDVLAIDGVDRTLAWAREVWNCKPAKPKHVAQRCFPWQYDFLTLIKNHNPAVDNRKIHFFIDGGFGAGKSEATKIAEAHFGATALTVSGTTIRDLNSAYNKERCVIFDIPFDCHLRDWPFQMMENLKNGRITVAKYQSHNLYFESPCVIVFCNILPDLSQHLAPDRIDLRILSPPKVVVSLAPQAEGNIGNVSDTQPWPNYGPWCDVSILNPGKDDRSLRPFQDLLDNEEEGEEEEEAPAAPEAEPAAAAEPEAVEEPPAPTQLRDEDLFFDDIDLSLEVPSQFEYSSQSSSRRPFAFTEADGPVTKRAYSLFGDD